MASQLPWLVVIGDWSEDDPAVAPHELELDPLSDCEPAALELAAVTAAVAARWAAMPPPRPRKTAALSTPAATRDRAAAWRRRRGRPLRSPARPARAAALRWSSLTGTWSIASFLSSVATAIAQSLRLAADTGLGGTWELAERCRSRTHSGLPGRTQLGLGNAGYTGVMQEAGHDHHREG
jgi:hypothetical protein